MTRGITNHAVIADALELKPEDVEGLLRLINENPELTTEELVRLIKSIRQTQLVL